MIYDGENMFFTNATLSSAILTSDVLDVGKGEASDNLHLVVDVTKDAGNGSATTYLETCKEPTFTTAFTLATYTAPTFTTSFPISAKKVPILSTKLPRGNQGYLRLRVQSTFTDGKITAGLVNDDDIPWDKD